MTSRIVRSSAYPDDSWQVSCARSFLRECCKPAGRYNKNFTTYLLKHVAERWTGAYITHDAFVSAAIAEGYKFRQLYCHTSGLLKIKVCIKALQRYQPGAWSNTGGWA
jgi:hypothetical protein